MTQRFLQMHTSSFWLMAAQGAFSFASEAQQLQQKKEGELHCNKFLTDLNDLDPKGNDFGKHTLFDLLARHY